MKDTLNINIRIAHEGPIPLTIHPREEEGIRSAARQVTQLYGLLHERFPERTPAELLALAALQFARVSGETRAAADGVDSLLADVEASLDNLLRATSAPSFSCP